ncbi:thiolase family protein [Pseudonocardia sichuanensis]|uniref:Acetyl-CoA acetyltransferase n=1 Tax=Pseudonocardia kunmingensis TaxID=630975 RepID=A0A543CXX4_9PSEU|nr:thiolase family protein [Pseudonocardia kunmingensis]TQM01935.1 acetyl-CoA acetyltransferase [Pseudonocardia kunmingensis]
MSGLDGGRRVHVVGIGLHRYQRATDTSFVELALTAVRGALADAGLEWPQVEVAYTGTTRLGMGVSRPVLRHLGVTGIPMTQVENASASSSSAFRLACRDVAAGFADVALAMGVDKVGRGVRAEHLTGLPRFDDGLVFPAVHYGLLAEEYLRRYDADATDLARVAVKNHANGARNPFAQRQRERTLEEVLDDRRIAGDLTRLQCCPVGEGAAAALVVSDEALHRLGLDAGRAVEVLASAQRSEELYGTRSFDAELTRTTTAHALAAAGVAPAELDVVELHDAFTIEELQYVEAMGLCPEGEGAKRLTDGEFHVGGRVAVSPSGGLLAMGHPIGPTGVGQIAEVTRQLRGEAGERQQPGARYGLAHLVGVGAVCVAHVLGGPGR